MDLQEVQKLKAEKSAAFDNLQKQQAQIQSELVMLQGEYRLLDEMEKKLSAPEAQTETK